MSQYHLGILIVKGNLMPVGSGPTRERLPKGLLQLGFHTAPKKQSDLPKKRVWCLMFMKSYLMATPTSKKGLGGKTLSRNQKKGTHGFNGWLCRLFVACAHQIPHHSLAAAAWSAPILCDTPGGCQMQRASELPARWSSITCAEWSGKEWTGTQIDPLLYVDAIRVWWVSSMRFQAFHQASLIC